MKFYESGDNRKPVIFLFPAFPVSLSPATQSKNFRLIIMEVFLFIMVKIYSTKNNV